MSLLQQLKEGQAALYYDERTLDDLIPLNKVLLYVFPNDVPSIGAHKIYRANGDKWFGVCVTSLPSYPLQVFIDELKNIQP